MRGANELPSTPRRPESSSLGSTMAAGRGSGYDERRAAGRPAPSCGGGRHRLPRQFNSPRARGKRLHKYRDGAPVLLPNTARLSARRPGRGQT
jgi:hypothetical protein